MTEAGDVDALVYWYNIVFDCGEETIQFNTLSNSSTTVPKTGCEETILISRSCQTGSDSSNTENSSLNCDNFNSSDLGKPLFKPQINHEEELRKTCPKDDNDHNVPTHSDPADGQSLCKDGSSNIQSGENNTKSIDSLVNSQLSNISIKDHECSNQSNSNVSNNVTSGKGTDKPSLPGPWQQAAVVTPDPRPVTRGHTLTLSCRLSHSALSIDFL